MKMLVAMMVLVSVALSVADAQQLCRQWCKKERPLHEEQPLYCCDTGIGEQPLPDKHAGDCPVTRVTCLRDGFEPPNVCAHDGFCGTDAKCCWDACLDHHTCKPAQFLPVH